MEKVALAMLEGLTYSYNIHWIIHQGELLDHSVLLAPSPPPNQEWTFVVEIVSWHAFFPFLWGQILNPPIPTLLLAFWLILMCWLWCTRDLVCYQIRCLVTWCCLNWACTELVPVLWRPGFKNSEFDLQGTLFPRKPLFNISTGQKRSKEGKGRKWRSTGVSVQGGARVRAFWRCCNIPSTSLHWGWCLRGGFQRLLRTSWMHVC